MERKLSQVTFRAPLPRAKPACARQHHLPRPRRKTITISNNRTNIWRNAPLYGELVYYINTHTHIYVYTYIHIYIYHIFCFFVFYLSNLQRSSGWTNSSSSWSHRSSVAPAASFHMFHIKKVCFLDVHLSHGQKLDFVHRYQSDWGGFEWADFLQISNRWFCSTCCLNRQQLRDTIDMLRS